MIVNDQHLHGPDYWTARALNQGDNENSTARPDLGPSGAFRPIYLAFRRGQHRFYCSIGNAFSEGDRDMNRIIRNAVATAAALTFLAQPALAKLIAYNVNLNFDPKAIDGGPGVGTVTGTVTIDTATTAVTAVDLVEKTNDGLAAIGGGFGSQAYDTFTFNQTSPFTIVFFGSPLVYETATASTGQNNYEFGGQPFIRLFFQTDCCNFDGTPIGPSITFDFPYPGGGSVQPGNFDSITSETKYLFGTVTPVTAPGAPEPATWAMMGLGFAGLGFAGYRTRRRAAVA
jgi:hypothetical protein